MKKVSYYPGCSLEGSAKDYNESIHAVCSELGIDLEQLADWSCCGATAAHSVNHKAAIALSNRNLNIACKAENDLLVPCPLCFNRLKTAQKTDSFFEENIKIWDLANFMGQDDNLSLIQSKVRKTLNGIKAVCYYGCMYSRPPKITDAKDCENPMSIDRILDTLGVTTIQWPFKTDCCGASHVIARQDIVFKLVEKLYKKAVEVGANCIVVSCQMCQANLDMYQEKICHEFNTKYYLPIIYFTELIGLSMAHKDVGKWFSRHFVNPDKLMNTVGITI